MDMNKLIAEMQGKLVHLISPAQLDGLLSSTKILAERNTLISGYIRILQYDEYFITQESTNKNELSLRLFQTKEAAEELVSDHMETYDQMWDGCGCKVNYYS